MEEERTPSEAAMRMAAIHIHRLPDNEYGECEMVELEQIVVYPTSEEADTFVLERQARFAKVLDAFAAKAVAAERARTRWRESATETPEPSREVIPRVGTVASTTNS